MSKLYPCICFAILLVTSKAAWAEVALPHIFGDHMVLQRDQKNRIWGKAEPGENVTISIEGQSHTTTADEKGHWLMMLDPLEAGGPYALKIQGSNNELEFKDVLIGEVWICSGQSNMRMAVRGASDGDLERAAAKFPNIRLMTIPNVGTQEPQWDVDAKWEPCSPETVATMSAVGYFFGRQVHQTIEVPVGLINNAWGGSACEAWVARDLLAADERYHPLLAEWEQLVNDYDQKVGEWKVAADQAKASGKQPPQHPDLMLKGNKRPANIYNGVLKPTVGYGIRGVIWYQGEANAQRAYQYRTLFPLMIQSWREEWGQGDFPFYWVQLPDFRSEQPQPGESDWAELREAQTMALKLPATGQAVTIGLGEAKDIHPKNKQDVAKRLARLALTEVYGVKGVAARSPEYKSMEVIEGKVVLTFDDVGAGWRPFDVAEPVGFAIAGADRKFVWAKARLLEDQIEVWSDEVQEPIAVRYAWADNPVCNLYNAAGLPLTPFRTDDWPGKTIHNVK